jgi:hypothetical protein
MNGSEQQGRREGQELILRWHQRIINIASPKGINTDFNIQFLYYFNSQLT